MLAPVLPEGAFSAMLLFWLLSWGVALGLLWIWMATFHHLFQGIAKALSFTVKTHVGYSHTFHLGSWATTIDHAAQQWFSNWAIGAEILVGKTWHAMAEMFWAMSHAISDASSATLDFGHWMVHDYVPGRIKADLGPLRNKTNKAAATAAAAAAGLAALKHEQREGARHQATTNKVAKAETKHAEHTATHAKAVATTTANTVTHETKVITQVVEVHSLPVPFGRTVSQLRRLARKHEAIIGATVFAAAMANVLGVPNPRCLTKGPFGRFARTLCGMPSNLLNDFLGLLADFVILENICTVLPWLESAASEIGTPFVEVLTEVGAGLCRGSKAPGVLRGPKPSVPALIFGVSASGV